VPNWNRLFPLLLKGLLGFRWIAMPVFIWSVRKPRLLLDLETEFTDGTFLVTSNAMDAGLVSVPPTIDAVYLPYETALVDVYKTHRERLDSTLSSHSNKQVCMLNSSDDVITMQKRLKQLKDAWRVANDWLTRPEAMGMSSNPQVAEQIYREIEKLRKSSDRH
jgi:hypothetical protein